MTRRPSTAGLGAKLRNRVAARRATRVAIVVPVVLWVLIHIPPLAGSALFGVFAALSLLLFADFGGPLRDRFAAYAATTALGTPIILVGVVLGQTAWSASVIMFVVALIIGLAGVLRGPVASAQTVLLLVTVLAVTSAPPGSQWTAIVCWLVGGLAAGVAAGTMWPAQPSRRLLEPLGELYHMAGTAVRTRWVDDDEPGCTACLTDMDSRLQALHGQFDGNLLRPSGLTNMDRAIAQWVDLVGRVRAYQRWPHSRTVVDEDQATVDEINADLAKTVATELELIGTDIETEDHGVSATTIQQARDRHLERTTEWVAQRRGVLPAERIRDVIDASFPLRLTAISTELAAASANPQAHFDDPVLAGELAQARRGVRDRISRNIAWTSPWFRNALRSAIALAIAVALAKSLGLQHGFWIVLGALTALRFDALGTGRTAMQALLGTAAGVGVGAALILAFGNQPLAWWFLLPLVLLVTGYTPGNFSLTVGQAGFSVTVIVLFSVLFPATLATAELRLIDVAIGLGVSLVVSAVMWPHGVVASLHNRMTDAFTASSDYLLMSMDYVVGGAVDRQLLDDFARRSSVALERAREAYDLSVAQKPPHSVPVRKWFRAALVVRHIDAAARQLPGAAKRVTDAHGGRTVPEPLVGPILDTTRDVRENLHGVVASWKETDMARSVSDEADAPIVMPLSMDPDDRSVQTVAELRHAIDRWIAEPSDWHGVGPDPRPVVLSWTADWEAFIAWNADLLEEALKPSAPAATH